MRRGLSGVVALGAAISLVWAAVAEAATYQVTRTGDPPPDACTPADCSLREGVIAANASIGVNDVIELPNRRSAYRLTRPGTDEDSSLNGDLDVTGARLTIRHPGRGRATIDASGLGERVLEVLAPTTVQRLVLTGGQMSDDGAGILAEADLTVAGSVLRENRAVNGSGGAIYHQVGVLKVLNSRLTDNRADDEAGAIRSTGERFVISRSVLRGNVAGDSRVGGVYSWTNTTSRIDRTTFADNRAPTTGAALYVNAGLVRITNSTFNDNRMTDDEGGALYTNGAVKVTNSTFSGNRATEAGGAIYVGSEGSAELNAVTVARNIANSDGVGGEAGGGIFNAPGGDFDIANSIIALNDQRGGGAGDDCSGHFTSGGGNLRGGSDAACSGFNKPGDAINSTPKLSTLANNGGPTMTIALLRGSPAIGRARASAPPRDQRGRRRDGDPDSGAFERGG